MDLIRAILLQVEESDRDPNDCITLRFGEVDEKLVAYHVWLLADAGLIKASDLSTMDGFSWEPNRLTWAGHEFLQSIRDDSVWTKAKESVLKPTASWTFGVLKEWLKQEIKQKVGIP